MLKFLPFFAVLCAFSFIASEATPVPCGNDFASQVNASYFRLREDVTLTTVEAATGTPTNVVFVLHGVLMKVAEIVPLVNLLQQFGMVNTRFIIPQAPDRFVTFWNMTGPSWFDYTATSVDGPQILFASSVISELADEQASTTGLPRSKFGVIGISQGGGITLTTYLRNYWAGAVGIATALPLATTYPQSLRSGPFAPIQLLHGTDDAVIPVTDARMTRDAFQALGIGATLTEFAGEGHAFQKNETLIAAYSIVTAYLTQVLG